MGCFPLTYPFKGDFDSGKIMGPEIESKLVERIDRLSSVKSLDHRLLQGELAQASPRCLKIGSGPPICPKWERGEISWFPFNTNSKSVQYQQKDTSHAEENKTQERAPRRAQPDQEHSGTGQHQPTFSPRSSRELSISWYPLFSGGLFYWGTPPSPHQKRNGRERAPGLLGDRVSCPTGYSKLQTQDGDQSPQRHSGSFIEGVQSRLLALLRFRPWPKTPRRAGKKGGSHGSDETLSPKRLQGQRVWLLFTSSPSLLLSSVWRVS